MWKFTSLQMSMDKVSVDKFKKYARVGGILFLILGLIGIIFPTFMTISAVVFVSYLMLFSGVGAGYLTWMSNPSDWAGWLKSFALIIIAMYMLYYPVVGAGTLGILLSIYYFMDAFASFGIGLSSEGKKHKFVWFFNALISFLLAIIFVITWPFASMWLVGFFVGMSLFFDGVALLFGGLFINEIKA
ncbi:MAG: uncharacterized membrane protein HdeD (DUF308 family) [Sulfurimonas sp.]|jgi:uncharacterized membrane protein HdeD (DUF308 family)